MVPEGGLSGGRDAFRNLYLSFILENVGRYLDHDAGAGGAGAVRLNLPFLILPTFIRT